MGAGLILSAFGKAPSVSMLEKRDKHIGEDKKETTEVDIVSGSSTQQFMVEEVPMPTDVS